MILIWRRELSLLRVYFCLSENGGAVIVIP